MKEFVLSLLLTMCFVGCSIRKNSDETKQPVSTEQTDLDTNEVSDESPLSPQIRSILMELMMS